MRRGAPSSPPAPSRGRTRDSALWLGAQLCQALQGEQDAMVEALLRQGADPNLVLPEGIAAVHLAAGMEPASGVPCLACILQYGGDPNLRSVDGLTPLHVAASWGHDTRVRLLLMEGGNPWLEDQEGNTALDLARKHGNEGCALILRGCLEDTEEEEQSSWTSQRRAESFLSTVTTDPWEAEGSLGFCPPPPALPGRTPESGVDPPGGPRSCCFPSVVAAVAARGGAPENGLEEEEEDWQPLSFLTECSWQDATGPNRGGLPPRRVSSRDPPGPSAKEEEEEEEAANDRMAEGAWVPQPPRDWPGASVKASGSRSLESRSSREGDLSPGPESLPRGATLSSPEASPPGVRPGALSAAGSPETPKPPPPRPEGPGHKDDLERRDTGATLDLTQDSRFLDPELVVRIGRHQGLDVTSPDHAYLFSWADPATLSDLERTVAVGGEPGGGWETGKPFCQDSGGSGGGGSSSLYASCHSECYGGTTDTSGCQAAQQSSSDRSPGCSGTGSGRHPRQVPLGRGLCCEEGPVAGSPDRSAGAGPLQGGCCLGGAFPRMDSEKQPGDAQVSEGFREASPSRLPHVPLMASPWQKEGSGKPPARPPLRKPQSLSPRQAEKEVLPESHPFPKGTDMAALEPRREGGRRRMPDGRGDLEEEEEEEEGETAPAGVSGSTQVVLGTGESPWTQDTLLVQRPPEDVAPFGSCGGPLSAGESEGAGFTLPVQDGPAWDTGDEPDRLEVQLRSMMLATKFRHITHRAATPDGGGSSSSSSSLFEETLEMPRRPRRVRSPEAKPPPSCKEPHGTLCPETSILPRTEADGPDRGLFIAGSPSSSQPGGSGPSDLPPAAPAMPMDRYFHGPGGSAGRGPSGDPEAKSPGQEREPSPPRPRSHQGDATSLETAPAERPEVSGGEAKGPPRPARVSFSRRPARGLPCPPAMSARPPGRLSPGSQAVPLSPGGRPLHVSTTEPVEFLYVDEDQGHTLVERHVPCTDDSLANTTAEDTVLYDWRAYAHPAGRQGASPPPPASGDGPLSDEDLASRLRDLGVHPGPVTGLTRKLYLQLLEKLSGDPKTKARKGPSGYSPELSLALETYQIPDGKGDEMALAGQFDQPDKRKNWREGLLKSSFNYLLLDPRVTQNLPFRSQFVSQAECFRTFVSAVFYVGKGKRSRPYSHLYEALSHHHHRQGKGREKEVPPKVRHILEVWAAGQGVVSMHCFQNVIPVEAYTREACMVDAIGLKMLTNQKRGHYYGVVAGWPMKRRRRLGVHLLHRAMQILLAEGERQLRPADIQAGP